MLLTCKHPADWLLTRGNVFVGYLYDPSRTNKHYYYHAGWNIQAYVAYVAGIALPFAGFVGTLGASVSPEALRLGDLGWMISFVTSFLVYYGLCLVWPTRNQKTIREQRLSWEQAGNEEIIAPDGTTIFETGSRVYAGDSTGEEPSKVNY